MRDIPSTALTDQAPPRQEIGEYYGIELSARGNTDTQENPAESGPDEDMTTAMSEFYKPQPNEEPHDQGQLSNVPRVGTVNLERGIGLANPQAASSGSSVSTNADEVERKLYDSWWFWIWLWFWILGLICVTTYGTTQGIVI